MDLTFRLLYILLCIAVAIYLFLKLCLGYWKRRGILHENPNFWYGNIKGVGAGGNRHIGDALQTCYQKYKGRVPFIGFYVYIKPYILVLDLELINQIMQTDAATTHFLTRRLYNDINIETLSYNFMQLDGSFLQHLHDIVNRTYANQNVLSLMPRLLKIASVLKTSLDATQNAQRNLVINDLIDGYNYDVIAELVFGIKVDGSSQIQQCEFRTMARSYMCNLTIFKAFMALEYPKLASLLQYKNYNRLSEEYFQKIIYDHLKEHELDRKDKAKCSDNFLHFFITESRNNTKFPLNDKQIASYVFTFILNGLMPLNATISLCLYELSLQPELQQRARAEITKVLNEHNGQLKVACLNEFVYLKQVLKETLRLHSPYPFMLWKATKQFEVPNTVFTIAQGNNVIIPVSAIYCDSSIYPEPARFDPQRFDDSKELNRYSMTWLPFGVGSYTYTEWRFVELQMLVGLVILLQDYQFSPSAETQIPLKYDNNKIILTPKPDIVLCVERVHKS